MRQLRKAVNIFLSLTLILLLGACHKDTKNSLYPPVTQTKTDEVFLYHPFSYQLGVYNLKSMKWDAIITQEEFFQAFDWGNIYPYYVVGSPDTHNFNVGKCQNSTINYFYSLDNKKQNLTPLATDGNTFLYLIEQVDDNICLKRVVTISEDGKTKLIANLDGYRLMSGVLIDNNLYFACYSESSDDYEVWCLNLSESTKQPKLIRKGYDTFKIYKYRNQLMYIDTANKLLYNDNYKINLSHETDMLWIDEKHDLLIEEFVNDANDLEISFTNLSTGKIAASYPDAINFAYEDNQIVVYGNGFIEHFDFDERQ